MAALQIDWWKRPWFIEVGDFASNLDACNGAFDLPHPPTTLGRRGLFAKHIDADNRSVGDQPALRSPEAPKGTAKRHAAVNTITSVRNIQNSPLPGIKCNMKYKMLFAAPSISISYHFPDTPSISLSHFIIITHSPDRNTIPNTQS